jgi:hypothetical protein
MMSKLVIQQTESNRLLKKIAGEEDRTSSEGMDSKISVKRKFAPSIHPQSNREYIREK